MRIDLHASKEHCGASSSSTAGGSVRLAESTVLRCQGLVTVETAVNFLKLYCFSDLNTWEVVCRLLQLMLTVLVFCTRNCITIDPSICIAVMNDATGFMLGR
jgi:hypothetical protein